MGRSMLRGAARCCEMNHLLPRTPPGCLVVGRYRNRYRGTVRKRPAPQPTAGPTLARSRPWGYTSRFIDRLSIKRQVALDNQIDRLNMLTSDRPHLPFPHSSQLEGELRELRCHFGRELYRVLYRRSRNLVVLLHIFRKDSGRIPTAEITIAQDRWSDFTARMNASRRRRPRAAGHDAP